MDLAIVAVFPAVVAVGLAGLVAAIATYQVAHGIVAAVAVG